MKRKSWLTEAVLSERTGVSRTSLAYFRKKQLDRGLYRKGKGKGRPVEYSEIGVELVLEHFGIKEADLAEERTTGSSESEPARNQEPPALTVVPDLKLLTVSKIVPNKRILWAQNGGSEVFQVIVPSSEVFAVGDPFRAKPSQNHKGYYELVGKAPRWRGDRIYRHEFV